MHFRTNAFMGLLASASLYTECNIHKIISCTINRLLQSKIMPLLKLNAVEREIHVHKCSLDYNSLFPGNICILSLYSSHSISFTPNTITGVKESHKVSQSGGQSLITMLALKRRKIGHEETLANRPTFAKRN